MKHSQTLLLFAMCVLPTPLMAAQTFPPGRARASVGLRSSPRAGEASGDSSVQQPRAPGTPSVIDFGTIDFPGAPDSAVYRVNNHGQFVGGYGPDTPIDLPDFGFILTKTSFKKLRFPAAAFTQSIGLNDAGEVVGTYIDTAGNYHGFKLVNGHYTSIDPPGSVLTVVTDVNDSGEIVGLYYDAQNVGYGFSLVGKTYTSFEAPGSKYTAAQGVNNKGQIVGEYWDSSNNYHGFLFEDSVFTTVDYPGAVWTSVLGINAKGDVVGRYGDGVSNIYEGFEHGFEFSGGQYLTIDVPFAGAGATQTVGINKSGRIAGWYMDTSGRMFGYTARIVP